MEVVRLIKSFLTRIKSQKIHEVVYLVYFHIFLGLYDIVHSTRFRHTRSAKEMAHNNDMTGSFPIHPWYARRLLRASSMSLETRLLDVGCGTGMALYVASRSGMKHLHGIEMGDAPYEDAKHNLKNRAVVMKGDALSVDLNQYDALFFFNSFRGETADRFFANVPQSIRCIITVNCDPRLFALLSNQGYRVYYSKRSVMYKNFSSIIWKR